MYRGIDVQTEQHPLSAERRRRVICIHCQLFTVNCQLSTFIKTSLRNKLLLQRDDKPSLEKGVRQNNEKKQIRKDQQYENPSFSFVLRDTKAFYSYRFVHFTIRFCDMDFVSSLSKKAPCGALFCLQLTVNS